MQRSVIKNDSFSVCMFVIRWEQACKTRNEIFSEMNNFSGHMFVSKVWMSIQTHKGVLSPLHAPWDTKECSHLYMLCKTHKGVFSPLHALRNTQRSALTSVCSVSSRHTKECSHLCVLCLIQKLQRGLQQGLDLRDVSGVVVLQTQFACHPVQKHGHRDGEGGDAFVGVWVAAKRGQVVQLDQVEPLAWKIIVVVYQ